MDNSNGTASISQDGFNEFYLLHEIDGVNTSKLGNSHVTSGEIE